MAITFSGAGILDGQIIYDNNVSQSSDAFTKAVAYDITISGSLEVTGSLLLTGSLINEYTGQFKTLGIGVVAPTEPSMLHIKTIDSSGDPVALIESTAGGDDAAVRFANDQDTVYNVGLFGSLGESFRIQQDVPGGGSLLNPFIIDSGVIDYTLYLFNNSIGVGLGINTPTILGPLASNSLQSAGTLTGSLLQGNIISASWDGLNPNIVNIHGTSSYSAISITGITASYVQSTNIDFSVGTNTITQNILSSNILSSTSTSSFGKTQMGVGGITRDNSAGFSPNYKIISGSNDYLQIGDLDPNTVDEGTRLEINSISGTASILSTTATKGDLEVDDQFTIGSNLLISGSSTPSLQVGPANAASPSFIKLNTNTLQVNNKFGSFIYNDVNKQGVGGTGTMALSVGADPIESNIGIYASQSNTQVSLYVSQSTFPVISNNFLALTGASQPASNQEVNIYKKLGHINGYSVGTFGQPDKVQYDGVFGQQMWRLKEFTNTFDAVQQSIPVLKLSSISPGFDGGVRRVYNFKVSMAGSDNGNNYGIITFNSTWIYNISQPVKWKEVGTTPAAIPRGSSPYFSALTFNNTIGTTSVADDTLLFNLILPANTPISNWSGNVEVDMLTNKDG